MGCGVGAKEKRGHDLRHYCNSSHYSTFFNFRGLQPAFGQGLLNSDSHTFAHEPLPRCSFKLVQSQLSGAGIGQRSVSFPVPAP